VAFDFQEDAAPQDRGAWRARRAQNRRQRDASSVLERWENPVLTAAHVPLFWRHDLDRRRNPFLLEGSACTW
jgi:hypothetical protein